MAKVNTVGMRKLEVQITAAGTRKPISPTTLFVTDFELHPKAGNAGAAMYIGNNTVDNTWIPRAKGFTVNFTHGTGTWIGCESMTSFDLNKIYLDADANNDTAIIQYLATDGPT